MKLEKYIKIFNKSKDVNDFVRLAKKAKIKKKVTTIKRDYYRVRKIVVIPKPKKKFNEKPQDVKIKKDVVVNKETKNEEHEFEKYTSSYIKKLKLEDFKKYKVKLTDSFLAREGFTLLEINNILGRNPEVERLDFEEDIYI